MKYTYFVILLFLLNSCFVSRKKYNLLKQEIEVIKSDLKDDDNDGIPNYLSIIDLNGLAVFDCDIY
jgi:hypothetical protein